MAAIDPFAGVQIGRTSPGVPFLITPHNTNTLAYVTQAVAIGTAGALKVRTIEGDDVVIPANALAVGVQHVMAIDMVYATGTGASEIVGYRGIVPGNV